MTQQQAATELFTKAATYLLWEKDRAKPTVRYYPAILTFLGYDPFPRAQTLAGKIAAKRRALGMTIDKAAQLAGVDPGTFAHWEKGTWRPRMSHAAVERFLSQPTPLLGAKPPSRRVRRNR